MGSQFSVPGNEAIVDDINTLAIPPDDAPQVQEVRTPGGGMVSLDARDLSNNSAVVNNRNVLNINNWGRFGPKSEYVTELNLSADRAATLLSIPGGNGVHFSDCDDGSNWPDAGAPDPNSAVWFSYNGLAGPWIRARAGFIRSGRPYGALWVKWKAQGTSRMQLITWADTPVDREETGS